ncbi:MAG: hypothetical protein AVDCRST_MAG22-1113 [uncultured Rubrobacteraceae bacterium]|uniref:Uncharacterized protein n=1 Tax=uncultured Rubrobacteraceae bacterium TaxID=349277 RepID=A0A6J4P6C2_9ACTN|nr:MAG: hypothetical protein AVDCRST_MAG22-1113 [uncultured Rubrobacteraceae bacterium]
MATDPTEILNRRNAEVAKIRGFADLTEEAKERRIAAVTERAQAEYAETREADERARAERLESTKRAVFRVPLSPTATDAKAAQIYASYRAAWGDVYAFTRDEGGPAELKRILQQAERTGDKLLALATYHRGIDLGIQEIVNAYLAPRPAESRAWDAYTTAYQEADQAGSVEDLIGQALASRAFYLIGQALASRAFSEAGG